MEKKKAEVADQIVGKVWVTTSRNPRPEHKALNGEYVDKRGLFSNGLRYPRDYRGKAEDNANCKCKVMWVRKPMPVTID